MFLKVTILASFLWLEAQVAHQPLVSTSALADQIFTGARFQAPELSPPAQPRSGGEMVDDFLSVIQQVTPERVQERRVINRRSRRRAQVDLVRLPSPATSEGQGAQIMCGSQHIRHQRSHAYATPVAACLMSAVAQDWRRQFCPDNNPSCRLMIGDASHGPEIPSQWPHNTHRDGTCFDVWPMRRDGAGLVEVDVDSPQYSRERTAQLVQLMHRWGSDRPGLTRFNQQIFFNDPQLRVNGRRLTRSIRGHDGHIHVCFRNNDQNRRLCEQAQFDTQLCPELNPNNRPGSDSPRVATEPPSAPPAVRSASSRL